MCSTSSSNCEPNKRGGFTKTDSTESVSASKMLKMDTTDYSNTDESYKKLHLYIQPRKISIYGPHFKYGPNRRYPEDDNEEEDDEGGQNGETTMFWGKTGRGNQKNTGQSEKKMEDGAIKIDIETNKVKTSNTTLEHQPNKKSF